MSNNQVHTIVSGFINYLEKEGKQRLLPEIIKELETKIGDKKLVVVVESAATLAAKQKKMLTLELSRKFLTKDVQFEVNKNLLGGFKVIAGDEVLDFSTKAKLDYFSSNI